VGGGSSSSTTDEPLPEVTSTVAGSAVAGNSGGVGERDTQPLSEVVRLDDGTCVGWAGPGTGTWTQGLAAGARITVLDAKGTKIGTGKIGRPEAKNVAPSGNDQWMCTFPFSATIRGPVSDSFQIKVGSLRTMTAHRDPDQPSLFVASVSTVADPKFVDECAGAPTSVVTLWGQVVGAYWSDGLKDLCSSGIRIAKVERTCRPRTIGSDRIVAVVSAADPSTVYEDASGVKINDVAELGAQPKVRVRVANGQPCA
jgi:hypothetical protein